VYHRFLIESAVVPAAGYGLRMGPLTTVIPKEMFPLGDLPVIEYTVLELVSCGIKRICIVIRKKKEVIREYFHRRKALYKRVELHFAYQKAPLGLGDAIRKAEDFIKGVPFVMAIPDQILLSERPATRQLLDACKNEEGIWNSMVKIPRDEMHFFKDSRPFKYRKKKKGFYFIEDISTDGTSLIRGFGRTIFLPEAFEYMREEFINDQTGEVDLLKTFQALKNKFPLYGVVLEGRPCDIGTWEGYYFYQPIILNYLNSKEKSS
jgi:UTP--glucose-1-phosphate uridylyltransferase